MMRGDRLAESKSNGQMLFLIGETSVVGSSCCGPSDVVLFFRLWLCCYVWMELYWMLSKGQKEDAISDQRKEDDS